MGKIASKVVDAEQGIVTITPEGGEAITASLSDMPNEIVRQLALHGLSQKLGDSYAGAGQEDNPTAVVQANVTGLIDQLKAGTWSSRSGGGSGPRVTLLAEAIHRVTGKDLEDCVEAVGNLSNEEKSLWRKQPQVAQAIASIRAEREAEKAKSLEGKEGDQDLSALFS